MRTSPLKTAVLGAGKIADSHFEAIRAVDGFAACAVVDIDKDKAHAFGERYDIRAYTDYREMFDKECPDVAIIALPHFLHREAALYAAARGCHLLLEKPMALDVQQCDDILAAVREYNVRLLIGHTQHYFAENQRAKEILRSGELGQLVMINDVRHVQYYSDNRPEWFFQKKLSGGGILTNLGAHAVDKIQWITDSRVRSVKASLSRHGARGDVEGSGVIYLELDNGIPATISQSGYAGASRNETELVFTGGMLKLVTGSGLWISRSGAYEPVEMAAAADPYELQYIDLLMSIRERQESYSSGEYGRSVVAAIEHIYRSAATGAEQELPRV
ncbi:Gfo/Idh/MocA family protein [Paenibacillus sp. 1P07SE]|uniref:Gfo/Idh/MocA family protein n=1 Tax=Paenibacillus sp. 1P07SE TaxID=3132209 RepID=UPI0039A70691